MSRLVFLGRNQHPFAANPRWLGGVSAFTLVLHTWMQDLRRHLHVHALMACGGLQLGAHGTGAWVRPKRSPNFLFPVHALSRVFRAKFLQALQAAIEAGALPRDPANTDLARRQRLRALRRHDWVVYAKTPLAGPATVLDYLSRYTHRTAIGNERLVCIDGGNVLVRVRAPDAGAKRTIAMDGKRFIGRLLQHVLHGPRRGPYVAPGLQAHPPLRAAGAGGQDRAAGAGAQAAGDAGGQPAGARRRAGLHAPRGRRRDRVLPALQGRALACAGTVGRRSGGPRRHHTHRLPGATVISTGNPTSHAGLGCVRRPESVCAGHDKRLGCGLHRPPRAPRNAPRARSRCRGCDSQRDAQHAVLAYAQR